MFRKKFLGASLFSIILLSASPLLGEGITEKISRLNVAASKIEGDISSLKTQLGESKKKLGALRARGNSLRASEEKLQARLDELAGDLKRIEGEIETLQIQVGELSERKWKRIRVLDQTHSASSFLKVIADNQDALDFEDFLLLTRAMQQEENQLVRAATEGMKRLTAKQIMESELLENQKGTHEQIRKEREELSKILIEKQKEEAELVRQQKELQQKVIKLQGEALRLESILAGFTEARLKEKKEKKTRKVLIEAPREKGGDRVLKGRLSFPVDGEVTKKFLKGESGAPQQKGILIEVRKPEVVPVADGVVSFCGKLPFFGEAVIVEHSDAEFSLYGGLSKRLCSQRQDVNGGETPIGEVNSGENLYLELRRDGKPINPEPLISK